MVKRISYQYFFLGPGGRHTVEFRIEAGHEVVEVPDFDLEGDPANMPTVFDNVKILSIQDWTYGFDGGNVRLLDLPPDMRRDIVNAGIKFVNEQHKAIEPTLGHLV